MKTSKTRIQTEVIDLTLSDSDSDSNISPPAAGQRVQPDEYEDNTAGVLTLNEPRSARKPLGTPNAKKAKAPSLRQVIASSSVPSLDAIIDVQPGSAPTTPRKPKSSTPNTPRAGSKKATIAVEQERREAYAQKVFDELNRIVFSEGLPVETKLNWNVRLLTTAGRAKWHRSKDGTQTVEIELAVKILDEDARIRNTLAHEMCHLACWIIDKTPQENHGRLFKSWATKVMRKMPHIEITTRHSYNINYPYEWKCEGCAKIKSIRTDECVCGACKVGKLVPLFTTRTSSTSGKASVGARNAASTGLDSPTLEKPSAKSAGIDSDDDDFDRLVQSLGGLDITSSMI
ncbi:hypothetical protein EUX98_g4016 [Antrodiella citrinella]|uniref:SprT-like domain-containing protein n=1 Tax=Antrodiella citrinella TaxID=2447956 RepID=A0A4V3XIQ9_9APHY|nr:hypothetical protein EUX98_g4016 [Antrodiella citrinella]